MGMSWALYHYLMHLADTHWRISKEIFTRRYYRTIRPKLAALARWYHQMKIVENRYKVPKHYATPFSPCVCFHWWAICSSFDIFAADSSSAGKT